MREYMGNNDPKYSRTAKNMNSITVRKIITVRANVQSDALRKRCLFFKNSLRTCIDGTCLHLFRGNVVLHVGKRFTNVVRTAPRQCRLNHDL